MLKRDKTTKNKITEQDAVFTERCVKAILSIPGAIAKAIVIGTVADVIVAVPLKFAWNYVMPYLFGLPEIGFVRAFLLLWVLTVLWKITPVMIPTPMIIPTPVKQWDG